MTKALASIAALPKASAFHVAIDETLPVKLNRTIGSIVTGNPTIAGVRLQDSSTLLITGKASGPTTIMVRDETGRELWSGQIAVKAAAKLKAA